MPPPSGVEGGSAAPAATPAQRGTWVRCAGRAGISAGTAQPPHPPTTLERGGRRGRGEGGADNGPGPGPRRRQCPERGAGARPGQAGRRERAARPCRRSCWWSRRRARGRTR